MTDLEKKFTIALATDNYSVDEIQDIELDDYLVLTDEEADEACKDYIKQSLWAFNANFLASFLGCPTEAVQAVHDNGKCEDNNEVFLNWINESGLDIDDLVESVISADGRGHFISSYDGYEHEVDVDGETYYVYKLN